MIQSKFILHFSAQFLKRQGTHLLSTADAKRLRRTHDRGVRVASLRFWLVANTSSKQDYHFSLKPTALRAIALVCHIPKQAEHVLGLEE